MPKNGMSVEQVPNKIRVFDLQCVVTHPAGAFNFRELPRRTPDPLGTTRLEPTMTLDLLNTVYLCPSLFDDPEKNS